jgi:alpha-L-fucosidase
MQPNAVIMGGTQPDVRWPGNEDGLAPYPLWNVVAPGEEAANYLPVGVTGWLVPEADVFTRPSWFWTPDSDDKLLSLERLRDIYMRSIGHGANLLINMTPDRRGRIPDAEVCRLSEFGDDIHIRFSHLLAEIASEGCWREGMTLELAWDNPCVVSSLVLEEDLQYGQRIGEYCIDAQVDGAWQRVLDGTTIGCRYIASLEPVVTKRLRLRVLDSLPLPKIRRFAAFGEK